MVMTPVDEIVQLASSAKDVAAFYREAIRVFCRVAGAQKGLVWVFRSTGFRLLCHLGQELSGQLQLPFPESVHSGLLDQALTSLNPVSVQNPETANGLAHVLYLPVYREPSTEVVELYLSANQEPDQVESVLRNLIPLICAARSFPYMDNKVADAIVPAAAIAMAPDTDPGRRILPEDLEDYIHLLHQSLDPVVTAMTVANETRRLLACDRVSVLSHKRGRFRIVAVSGQPSVNRRSNTVLGLERLARAVLPTRERFWFPGDRNAALPQISDALESYLKDSPSRTVIVCPIHGVDVSDTAGRQSTDHANSPIILGGIVIEHCQHQWDEPSYRKPVELVSRHAGNAIRNSHRHQQLFLYPVWRWMGKTKAIQTIRSMRIATLVLSGVFAATLALCLIPATFRVRCRGEFVPADRRFVFANSAGLVRQVFVDHGTNVNKGQSLVSIHSEELDLRLQETRGQIGLLEQRLKAIEVVRLDRDALPSGNQEKETIGESAQSIRKQIQSAVEQLAILQRMESRMEIVSPIAGQVLSWDIDQNLRDRPVSVGETLMEIADVAGPWRLELELPDRRIGHVIDEVTKNRGPLRVTFVIAADPARLFTGLVTEIGQVTCLNPEQEQVIRLHVGLEEPLPAIRQSRTGVVARIECGTRSLGYVWLHDILEFWQTEIWFRVW